MFILLTSKRGKMRSIFFTLTPPNLQTKKKTSATQQHLFQILLVITFYLLYYYFYKPARYISSNVINLMWSHLFLSISFVNPDFEKK